MPINIYPANALEDASSITITGTADTGYPEARLYDRGLDFYWKVTATQATTFLMDYGSAIELDCLFIYGHNFNGEDMQFQYSTDNFAADTNDAVVDWTQGDNNQIVKVMSSSETKRYWRVTVTSMANPEASELYFSLGYEFTVLNDANPQEVEQSNIARLDTVGGTRSAIKYGDTKDQREYTIVLKDATDLSNFKQVLTDLDGIYKPFLIEDLDDNYVFVELMSDPVIERLHDSKSYVNLSLLEVL